jgi:hypothetical protein
VATAHATRALVRAGLLVPVLLIVFAVSPASAQGKGNGNGRVKAKGGSGPVTSGSAAPASASGIAIRQFGAWLDDASLLTPGDAATSITFGHYRTLFGSQTDFPVVDASFGITRRAQFGVTVPYYHARFNDGTSIGGFGDVFLSGKVLLLEPGPGQVFGLAVSPVVELTRDPVPGQSSFGWGAPLDIEARLPGFRVFGSTGYFSRGALFAAGALEVPLGDRFVANGALTVMRATNESPAADAIGLSKARSDITGSVAYFVSPSMALFAGTGRTLGNADGTGTTFMLTAGVSISYAPRIGQ